MNTDTGQIYRDPEEIRRARARGETVVPVSEQVATAVEIGMEWLTRAERRAQRFPRNLRRSRTGPVPRKGASA